MVKNLEQGQDNRYYVIWSPSMLYQIEIAPMTHEFAITQQMDNFDQLT